VNGACEVWFRGVHSDVGGGNGNRGLNDITLKWMMSKAIAAELPITGDDLAELRGDPAAVPKARVRLPIAPRLIAAIDRKHYTVGPVKGWATPPSTCPIETTADEQVASELGAGGVEILPLEVQRRIAAMWEAISDAARAEGYSLADCKEALISLFQARVPLVTNDDELKKARHAAVRILAVMIAGARQRGYQDRLPEFFLNEALFKLPRTYPFTD
jgi:hypothetical protein